MFCKYIEFKKLIGFFKNYNNVTIEAKSFFNDFKIFLIKIWISIYRN